MSTKPPLLPEYVDGPSRPDPYAEIEGLKEEMEDLRGEMAQVREQAKREAVMMVLNLLSQALRQVASGKVDLSTTADTPSISRWDAIKQRLQPRLREAVDLLLAQGSMKRTQIAAALKMDYSNCTKNVVGPLLRQGLIVEDGQGLSLKAL